MLILTKSYVMGSIFRINVFIIYATRTIFIGNTDFGGPDSVRTYYKIFLIFHINLATIGGVLGLVQIITAFKDKFKWHRRIGPVASIIWFFTGITGVAVYLLLYVIYPGGETTSVIKSHTRFITILNILKNSLGHNECLRYF